MTFKWKDYRIKGRDRLKTMTLDAAEFIRRFLLHVLPSGFHRIRHYGLFASAVRALNIERAPFAGRARGLARALARRGGERGRKSFACASMSMLRRPDDHRRNVRRRAPCAFFTAEPDQDRHLMIAIAVLPASQHRSASVPAARRTRRALSSQRPPTFSKRRAHAGPSYDRDRKSSSSSLPPITLDASGPRSHTCDPSAIFKSP